jgi:integrase
VLALKPRAKRYFHADPELAGHYVRVMPTCAKTYAAVARDPYGKQIWHTIGSVDVFKIEEAREAARDIIKRIRAGKPPVEPPPIKPDSYASVAENWVKRHVVAKKLRSRYEIERVLNKYVLPHWGTRDFIDIKRSDIASLLDLIEDDHGKRQADATLAIIRGISNWYGTRHDTYISPFTRGMRRSTAKARDRILTDGELRKVWQAASTGTFGAFVKMLFYTVQRRGVVLRMRWADISDDGVWTIPTEDRAKGNAGSLQLPAQCWQSSRRCRGSAGIRLCSRAGATARSSVSASLRCNSTSSASWRRIGRCTMRGAQADHCCLVVVCARMFPKGSWVTRYPVSRASMIATPTATKKPTH